MVKIKPFAPDIIAKIQAMAKGQGVSVDMSPEVIRGMKADDISSLLISLVATIADQEKRLSTLEAIVLPKSAL